MNTEFKSIEYLPAPDTLTHPQGRSLKALAREFESLFIQQLLTVMKQGLGEDGLFEGNTGQDTYSAMMDQALAKALAERGGFGIAEPLYRHLQKLEQSSEESSGAAVTPPLPDPAAGIAAETIPLAPDSEDHQAPKADALLGDLAKHPISSGLGWRMDPFDGNWRYHRGVDFALEAGTPVRSVNAGKVVYSGNQGGYGNTVVVEGADGTRIRYAHLQEVTVRTGETVEEGAGLGAVGSTGRSTGPHLHVEVESRGRLANPLS